VNRFFVALCALTAACVPAFTAAAAQTPAPSPSPSASPAGSIALKQIGRVVTSDRRSESADQSSRPTYVVDREQIDDYGARTVADALQGVPGVDLFSYGPFGAEVNYGLRGASSAQTLVLVDGIPITDPTSGAVQLGQLSTIGIDRIEIVESGSSTLYGNSASGGVINIITRVPRGVYLEASDASFGDRDVRVGAGNGVAGFTLERHVSSGDYPFPAFDYGVRTTCEFVTPCDFPGGVRAPAYGDQSAGRLSLDLPNAFGFVVRARVDASATQVGVPGGLDFFTPTASQATIAGSALLELERRSAHSTLTIDLAGSQTTLAYVDPNPNDGTYGQDDVYTGRSQVSVRDAFTTGKLDAVAGVDLSRESGVFSFPVTPNYATSTSTPAPAFAFGQAESQAAAYVQGGVSPLQGTRLTAGLRAENDAPHGTVLAPSFGGTIRSGVVRFAGDVGESFRVPTLEDLYYPGFSNPNLQPEKAQTADATVSYDARQATLSGGWFDRNGSNFIISQAPTYIPFNAQHAAVAGVQLTAATKPRAGFVAAAGYTDLYRAFDFDTGGRLPSYPSGSVNLSLEHPFAQTRLDYGLRWNVNGSDGDDRGNVSPAPVSTYDAYDSLDAFLRYKLASGAILTLRGYNLGNEYAAPIFGYPLPGRRYSVELSTR
jgi:vitamin B12 transporter